ncbi:hypothetical protein E1B28_003209 [Marasmius oreades]|uniref:Blue (type 1) copper domain-containing protein n=1 Tax=Marasmius oreades TaxID=181124 RepID=A0A9P7RL24_9AGAR|nr:uncharacterized protein E1B28_003209 [Marasmius oreades]KAG7085664.1 hypothetical protein E1B28_003209 [Marasmius oreades]
MFDPANTQANVGDVVQFMFTGIPANHSITQSSFASPCTREDGGFDSGWVAAPTDHNGSLPPATWNLTVTNASHPIWFYCKQTVPQFHCSSGMVGAINGPTSGANSMDNFIKNAQGAGAPDQGVGGLVGQGASASALPGPITGDLQYFGTPISGVASATGGGSGGGSGTSGGANPTSTTGNGAVSARYSIPILTLVTIAMGFALA